VTPVEFRGDLWHQKTRDPGLSCGVVCVILRLAVLVEHRLVTDGQTDRQTDMASTTDALHLAVKTEWWDAGVVTCLERDADLHMAQLMPRPLTVSCFSKIETGFYRATLCMRSTSHGPVSVSVTTPHDSPGSLVF